MIDNPFKAHEMLPLSRHGIGGPECQSLQSDIVIHLQEKDPVQNMKPRITSEA